MVRTPTTDSNGINKGAWSEEEDNKLRAYIQRYGHWNWRLLPKYAGLARCGKSCRLRWLNYLKPGIKRGNFSKEEEDLIRELHAKLGNKWSAITKKLPGRTDNEIKNFWHTRIKKRSQRSQPAPKVKEHANFEALKEGELYEITPGKSYNQSQTDSNPEFHDNNLSGPDQSAFDRITSDDLSVVSSDSVEQSIQGDFWNDILTSNTCSSQSEEGYFWQQEVGGIYDLEYFDLGMNLF